MWLFKVLPQYLLPHHALSAGMHRLSRLRRPGLNQRMIRAFIRVYDVDMSEAEETDITRFPDFNTFFTRALKPDARPLDEAPEALVSPVDGRISQLGRIRGGRVIQAKGKRFTVKELLGGNAVAAERFTDGSYITIYLAPPDYHRIHMPVAGRLRGMLGIPGRLFSVSPATTAGVNRLFARNERIVNLFDTEYGNLALVMVGAVFVGSMETVWAGELTPLRERALYDHYAGVKLDKGQEMGRFNMGSTVILLFEQGRVEWRNTLKPGDRVRMGEKIGQLLK